MTMQPNDSPIATTISAAFQDSRVADKALGDLRAAGFTRVEISSADADRTANSDEAATPDRGAYEAVFFKGHESTASAFVDELKAMGFSEHDAHDLVEVMTGGGAIVTADAAADPQRVVTILEGHSGDLRYATAPIASQENVLAAPANVVSASADEAESVIRLRAERLEIEKQRVQHGEARVRKEVVTHLESIEVPVSREELVIEQVAFNADGTAGEISAGDVIRIPLSEEVVNVSKTVTATEDVRIGKRMVAEIEHVSETTREERLHVDTPANAPDTDR